MHDDAPRPPSLTELLCSKWTTHLLATAAELGLPDALTGGPSTAGEVARRTATDERVTYRLLRALASIGVVKHVEGECFALTDFGRPLCSAVPDSLRNLAIMLGRPWHDRLWEALPECAREGSTSGAKMAFGTSIWRYFESDRSAADLYNAAMSGRSVASNAVTAEAYDFSAIGNLVDVGGGRGRLLAAILQRYPQMRGVLFEQPEVARQARAELETSGLLDRCDVEGGDFLESIPSGGDAYIMAHVLHNWPDREAATILRNCRRACAKGGKLLVIDAVVKPDGERDWAKLVDLEMLLFHGGRERTAREFAALFEGAGFALERVIPTRSLDCLVEGTAV